MKSDLLKFEVDGDADGQEGAISGPYSSASKIHQYHRQYHTGATTHPVNP